jgi:hypothetical protein
MHKAEPHPIRDGDFLFTPEFVGCRLLDISTSRDIKSWNAGAKRSQRVCAKVGSNAGIVIGC